MDTAMIDRHEREDKRKAFIITSILYTILLILLILPLLTYPDPPPGQEGILVNLGMDFGQGDENAPEEITETTPEDNTEIETEPIEETQPVEETPVEEPQSQPTDVPEKEVVETTDPQAEAIKKREEEKKRQQQLEAERKRKAQEEAERKRREEEERKRREAERKKQQASGAFGGGSGPGKGNTGQSGNQGDPHGDPNASNLEGVSVGQGQVGGGLGSRGVLASPRVTDNSQEQGTVVVKVCVDANGKVISAEYTQAGSTTNSANLRRLAIANAKKWKFSKSHIDKQCGTIRYVFKLQ